MNIQVKDVNFSAEEKLLTYAKKRAEKLFQIYDHILSVDVNLKLENNHQVPSNKTAEIIVKVPGNELFAKKTSKTFEESCDASLEALRKQVDKYKERH